MTGWGPYPGCGRGGGIGRGLCSSDHRNCLGCRGGRGRGGWWRRGCGRRAGGTGAVAGVALVMVLGAGAPGVRPGLAGQHGAVRLAAGAIWQVVPTVSPQAAAKTQSALFGVSLAGAGAGWAVGNLVTTVPNPQGGPRLVVSRALAERWNGTSWRQVAMVQPVTQHALLQAVADLDSDDAWAVGFTGDVAPGTSAPSGGLVEHWDGTRWLIASTPGSSAETLNAVAGTGPDDVWVAGSMNLGAPPPAGDSTFFEHFNGTSWRAVPGPAGNFSADPVEVTALAALSPSDVWAVGTQNPEGSGEPGSLNMAAHWNGKTWTLVPTPDLGNSVSQADEPTGVTAISANDVWASGVETTGCQAASARSGSLRVIGGRSEPAGAAGGRDPLLPLALQLRPGGVRQLPGATGQCLVPYVLHWDGKTWSLITTPDPGAFGTALEGITALSASDIWAVGQTQSSANGPVGTLTERFNGTSWSVVASPDPGEVGNDELFAVATPGGGQLDAVGGAAVAGDPCLTDVSGTFCLRTLALHMTSG
jgi:hypothetical protein